MFTTQEACFASALKHQGEFKCVCVCVCYNLLPCWMLHALCLPDNSPSHTYSQSIKNEQIVRKTLLLLLQSSSLNCFLFIFICIYNLLFYFIIDMSFKLRRNWMFDKFLWLIDWCQKHVNINKYIKIKIKQNIDKICCQM